LTDILKVVLGLTETQAHAVGCLRLAATIANENMNSAFNRLFRTLIETVTDILLWHGCTHQSLLRNRVVAECSPLPFVKTERKSYALKLK